MLWITQTGNVTSVATPSKSSQALDTRRSIPVTFFFIPPRRFRLAIITGLKSELLSGAYTVLLELSPSSILLVLGGPLNEIDAFVKRLLV